MPKKPDRFERMVLKRIYVLNKQQRTKGFRCGGCMEYPEVTKLLRAEHAWIRRQIRDIERAQSCDNADIHAGVSIALYELEYRLTQRRK